MTMSSVMSAVIHAADIKKTKSRIGPSVPPRLRYSAVYWHRAYMQFRAGGWRIIIKRYSF